MNLFGQKKDGFIRNLDVGEKSLLVLRRHWIVYLDLVALVAIPLLVTCILLFWGRQVSEWVPFSFWSLFLGIFWMYFLQIIYIRWFNNQLDLTVVTTKRILFLEQVGFLTRKISECTLSQVQEVNAQKGGVLGNILHFGDISIHSAADRSDFHIQCVPHPLTNARRVHACVDSYRQYGAQGSPTQPSMMDSTKR